MNRRPDLPQVLLSVDLAREPDFKIGQLKICPSRRQVIAGDRQETIQPRVMQVLVALTRAKGAVVSREELIESCWEGITVGEDAINRCVAKIRQVAEFAGGHAFEIETIPRVGYRLKTSDEIVGCAVQPHALQLTVNSGSAHAASRWIQSRKGLTWWSAGIFLLVAATIAIFARLVWPEKRWGVENYRTFISSLVMVGHPAFSPDGSMIAYASGADFNSRKIFVRNLAGGDPVKVTSDAFDDHSPSWSSDALHLAYAAAPTGEPCRIMITTQPAGPTREAGRCVHQHWTSLSWRPQTQLIYFSDQTAGQPDKTDIYSLNLETGKKERITRQAGVNDEEPRVSPDGKWLAYMRAFDYGRNDLRIQNLANGQERTLFSNAYIASEAWTSDSRTLLTSAMTDLGTDILAVPINGEKPYQVYSTSAHIVRLSISADNLLAVDSRISRRNLARAVPQPHAAPDVVDLASGWTRSPAFTPDGTLAFVSNRSGENAIWLMKPGARPQEILSAGKAYFDRLIWSPDGAYLAFFSTENGETTARVITPTGTSVASFGVAVNYGLPTWTPDGKGLVVSDKASLRTWRVDVRNPSRRALVADKPWVAVSMLRNGIFAARADRPGIWQIDKGIRLVTAHYPPARDQQLIFLDDRILVPDFDSADSPPILAQPVAGGSATPVAYAPEAVSDTDLAVDQRTGTIVYVAVVTHNSNIDILRLAKR